MKSIPERSVEADLVYMELCKIEEGEIVTYAELSQAVGFDVQEKRGYLRTARNRAIRDDKVWFEAVYGVGIKRLTPPEIITVGQNQGRRSRSAALKGMRALGLVTGPLSREDQIRHNAAACILGAVDLFTRPRSRLKVETYVKNTPNKLDLSGTIELFRKHNKK